MWLARLLKISREKQGMHWQIGQIIDRWWENSETLVTKLERFCHWDKVRIGRARVLNETTAGSWSLLHRKRLFLSCGIRSWCQSYYCHATTRACGRVCVGIIILNVSVILFWTCVFTVKTLKLSRMFQTQFQREWLEVINLSLFSRNYKLQIVSKCRRKLCNPHNSWDYLVCYHHILN